MAIYVRRAKEDDVPDIVSANLSENPKAEKLFGTKSYTPENMYRFGGVWMHHDSCLEHMNIFRRAGGEVFVAEFDGKVVGFIEAIPDYDSVYGECMYIHVLLVHSNYRGRGIGSALVGYVVDFSHRKSIYKVCVVASEDSAPFYNKLGFRITETWYSVEIPTIDQSFNGSSAEISVEKAVEEILEGKYRTILGKFHPLRALLLQAVEEYRTLKALSISYHFYRVLLGENEFLVGIRKGRTIPNAAYAWSMDDMDYKSVLGAVMKLGRDLGIKKLISSTPSRLGGFRELEKVIWMVFQ